MNRQVVDVEKIAEAVLYEGYLLYPYRRSALKNQQRWTFGGVYPRGYSEATGGDDPWLMQTQCLVAGDAETVFEIKIRFLRVVARKVVESGTGPPRFVEGLRVGGQVHRPWEEAMEWKIVPTVTQDASSVCLRDLLMAGRRFVVDIPAGSDTEVLRGPDGTEAGAIVREWQSLQGTVEIRAEPLGGCADAHTIPSVGESVYRLTIRIANTTAWPTQEAESGLRTAALRQTFVSTHTILRVREGAFLSMLEPPPDWQRAAAECENIKTWPVLVGEPGERHTLLSSPIILYDYPQISPESQGNYFDATEIDELLALSVLAMTDDEKQEMRESDVHAREILERTEALSEEQLLKLHGVVRYLQPARREET